MVVLRLAVTTTLLASLVSAPIQCAGDPDESAAQRDTAEEALYELAERFKKEGNSSAWRTTLEQLIERYPNSRFAVRARDDLHAAEASR